MFTVTERVQVMSLTRLVLLSKQSLGAVCRLLRLLDVLAIVLAVLVALGTFALQSDLTLAGDLPCKSPWLRG
jgi:hypothetical protein